MYKRQHLHGDIVFDHVQFGYEPGQTIIRDFSARIQSGQKVALVGPTGAGKTTIVKLLMRFHELNGGRILVDGHNITDFTRRDLRSEFGTVSYTHLNRSAVEPLLTQGTVMAIAPWSDTDPTDFVNDVFSQLSDDFTLPYSYTLKGTHFVKLKTGTTANAPDNDYVVQHYNLRNYHFVDLTVD